MKITKPRLLGRFKSDRKTVNMYTGRNMQRGTDHYFYYKSGSKVMVSCSDYHNLWSRVVPTEIEILREERKVLMSLDKQDLVSMIMKMKEENISIPLYCVDSNQ